jgi:hypothetical protein
LLNLPCNSTFDFKTKTKWPCQCAYVYIVSDHNDQLRYTRCSALSYQNRNRVEWREKVLGFLA